MPILGGSIRAITETQTDEVNPAAIELARRRIRGFNQGIDLAMDEYLARWERDGS